MAAEWKGAFLLLLLRRIGGHPGRCGLEFRALLLELEGEFEATLAVQPVPAMISLIVSAAAGPCWGCSCSYN